MTESMKRRSRGKAYGEDLRRRAAAAVLEEGMSLAAAGRQFDVHWRSVARWVRRYREHGDLRPEPKGGDRRSWRIEAERERIHRLLKRAPGLSIRALRDRLAAEGLVFGTSTVHRFLQRHGLERAHRPAGAGPGPTAADDGGRPAAAPIAGGGPAE